MSYRLGLLLLFAVGLLLWAIFVFPTLLQVSRYYSYNKHILPQAVQWAPQEIHDELWRARADYQFTVAGKTYAQSEIFLGERYRNPYAATVGIEKLKQEHQWVWYDPQDPHHATLEKFFPVKKIIYAIITLGLLFYAVWWISRRFK